MVIFGIGTHLYFHHGISSKSISVLMKHLHTSKYTHLHIASRGGDVDATRIAVDYIKRRGDITTIGTGYVYSAAVLMFVSGNKRLITPSTRLMIHQVVYDYNHKMTMNELNFSDGLGDLKSSNKYYSDILTQRSGLSKIRISNMLKNGDHYISADEAIRVGLADGIY